MFNANKYFGPNDNYDQLNSHFFPALIKKIHDAKKKKKIRNYGEMEKQKRIIYVDDLADACIFL
jgi:GDP-L-fucose synthase